MKKILMFVMTVVATLTLTTSCIEEVDPQTNTVTAAQAAAAPGAYDNFVNAITSSLAGEFTYGGKDNTYPYDFGYPSFFLQRDVMGQDIVPAGDNNWFSTWYEYFTGLGPTTARSQIPWTYYYGWIKSCNTVLSMAGAEPNDKQKTGAGIAHAMRAMFYMDLARMFANTSYGQNPEAETVPIIKETTTAAEATNNPRASYKDMFAFILEDLNAAETLLAGYERTDVYERLCSYD